MNGRNGKQCRERWINHLKPDISKEPWSKEEDDVLIRAYTEIGTKWSEMEKLLKGRTENAIKNHWHSTLRKRKDVVSFVGSATGTTVRGGDGTEGTATNSRKRRRPVDDEGNRKTVSPRGVSVSMPAAPAAAPAAPIMPPKIAPPAVAPAAPIMPPKIAPPAAAPAAPIMPPKKGSLANANGQPAGTASLFGTSASREGA